jgi:hypothetical protein
MSLSDSISKQSNVTYWQVTFEWAFRLVNQVGLNQALFYCGSFDIFFYSWLSSAYEAIKFIS